MIPKEKLSLNNVFDGKSLVSQGIKTNETITIEHQPYVFVEFLFQNTRVTIPIELNQDDKLDQLKDRLKSNGFSAADREFRF